MSDFALDEALNEITRLRAEVERLRIQAVPLPSEHYTDKILVLEARCDRLEEVLQNAVTMHRNGGFVGDNVDRWINNAWFTIGHATPMDSPLAKGQL